MNDGAARVKVTQNIVPSFLLDSDSLTYYEAINKSKLKKLLLSCVLGNSHPHVICGNLKNIRV